MHREYWSLPAAHTRPGPTWPSQLPPLQSVWNVRIFGSLALGALSRGLCQHRRAHCLPQVASEGPTGQRTLSTMRTAAAVTPAQIYLAGGCRALSRCM